MTPKIILLVGLLASALWSLCVLRRHVANAIGQTAIELVEALFWGYAVYLLVAIPLNLQRLDDWRGFFGLLFFGSSPTGTQVIGLLAGAATAVIRFFEPFESPKKQTKLPRKFEEGRDVKDESEEPEEAPTGRGALRQFLDRIFR